MWESVFPCCARRQETALKSSQPRRCCFLGVSSRRLSIRFRQRRWRAKVTCKVAAFAFQHFQYRILSLFFERDLESKISDPIFAQQSRRAGASAPRRPCLQCRKRMLIKSSLPCRDLAFPTPNAAFSGSPPPPLFFHIQTSECMHVRMGGGSKYNSVRTSHLLLPLWIRLSKCALQPK